MHSHAADGARTITRRREPDAAQGITTALVGQDGAATCRSPSFLERIDDAAPGHQRATSVGHGTVRGWCCGGDYKRAATPAEIDAMKALVERGMKDGAVGLSSGLEYDPGFYATTDELVALAGVAARFGGFYSATCATRRTRCSRRGARRSRSAAARSVPVEISHMKPASAPVWGQAPNGLALVDAARRAGQDGDRRLVSLHVLAFVDLRADSGPRFRERREWQRGLDEIGGAANVLITQLQARSVRGSARRWRIARPPSVASRPQLIVQMIKRRRHLDIGVIVTAMDRRGHARDLRASRGRSSVPTARWTGRHPRGYGAFPRVLGRYVREQHVVSLEEAIAKMTGAFRAPDRPRPIAARSRPARRPTSWSSIPRRLPTAARRRSRARPPVGIDDVVVNGEFVLDRGRSRWRGPALRCADSTSASDRELDEPRTERFVIASRHVSADAR